MFEDLVRVAACGDWIYDVDYALIPFRWAVIPKWLGRDKLESSKNCTSDRRPSSADRHRSLPGSEWL